MSYLFGSHDFSTISFFVQRQLANPNDTLSCSVLLLQFLYSISSKGTSEVKKLVSQEQGEKVTRGLQSFYEIISNDEDTTLKTIVQITTGITSIVDKVQQFLNYWERKYKHLWDQDKDAYIRRYERAQKPLTSFIADIKKYMDLQVQILQLECFCFKNTLIPPQERSQHMLP